MSNKQMPPEVHYWFKSHLVAFHAGLLDEGETKRFEDHRESCADCREMSSIYRGEESALGLVDGHLPDDLLARWEALSPVLVGLEREMVARHIDSCERCRSGLEFLGFEPILRTEVSAEKTPILAFARAQDSVAKSERTISSGVDWRSRLGFSWAAVATAACFYLIIFTGSEHAPQNQMSRSLPYIMSTTLRGEDNTSILRISPASSQIVVVVRVASPGVVSESRMVDVYLPSGPKLTSVNVSPTEIESGRLMLVLDLGQQPESGIYRVVVHGSSSPADAVGDMETQFELIVGDSQ